jgi:hypothetical protein
MVVTIAILAPWSSRRLKRETAAHMAFLNRLTASAES